MNTALASGFQLLIISRLGVGGLSDLYYAATIVTGFVFTMFLDPLSNVLIPMFVEKAAEGNDRQIDLLWNSMAITLGGGVVILLLIYLPIRQTFPLIFRSLRSENLSDIGKIFIAYSLYMILFGALTVKNCYLFASGRPVAAQTNVLISWIISLIMLNEIAIGSDVARIADCLVLGNVVGLMIPNFGNKTWMYRWGHLGDHCRELLSRGVLLTSGSAIFKAESLLDGVISSFSGIGGLTIYQLFSRMLISVATIVNSGYIQPVTKHLAEAAGQGRWADMRAQAARAALWSSLASLACLAPLLPIVLFLRARPIRALEVCVRIVETDYPILLLMLGLLVGCVVWKVYATGLVVLRRERLFAGICSTTFLVGVAFKVLGAYGGGLAGLGLGTSLYWILGAACMAAGLRKSLREQQGLAWTAPAQPSPTLLPTLGSTD